MDIAVLAKEIGDNAKSASGTYSAMTSAQVAAELNRPRKTGTTLRVLTTMEVLDALREAAEIAKVEGETTEAAALSAYLYGAGSLNMAVGSVGRTLLTAVVSAAALARCVAAATEDVMQSRAEELGLETVGDGHVRSCQGWEAR